MALVKGKQWLDKRAEGQNVSRLCWYETVLKTKNTRLIAARVRPFSVSNVNVVMATVGIHKCGRSSGRCSLSPPYSLALSKRVNVDGYFHPLPPSTSRPGAHRKG